jgi:hypothetical protein
VIGASTTLSAPAAAKDITPWRFVGMMGTTLLSFPIPSRKGGPTAMIRFEARIGDVARSRDRTKRRWVRPMIFFLPSPQVRPVIEHQFPTSGGDDALPWRRPRGLGVEG